MKLKNIYLVWWDYGYASTQDKLLAVCDSLGYAEEVKDYWIDRLPTVWITKEKCNKTRITQNELEGLKESY